MQAYSDPKRAICACETCTRARLRGPVISYCPDCGSGKYTYATIRCEKRGIGEYGEPLYAGSHCLKHARPFATEAEALADAQGGVE